MNAKRNSLKVNADVYEIRQCSDCPLLTIDTDDEDFSCWHDEGPDIISDIEEIPELCPLQNFGVLFVLAKDD